VCTVHDPQWRSDFDPRGGYGDERAVSRQRGLGLAVRCMDRKLLERVRSFGGLTVICFGLITSSARGSGLGFGPEFWIGVWLVLGASGGTGQMKSLKPQRALP
jgi:hypothetical protein